MIKKRNPDAQITMTDIHAMALASARKTLAENQLEGDILASDVFSNVEGKFDLIISNPPFHDGINTAYRTVQELIGQAKKHLNQGGELRIVANAFLPYADLLQHHFDVFDVLAQTSKFIRPKISNGLFNKGVIRYTAFVTFTYFANYS